MKAVLIREPGGPEVLEIGEYPTPSPGPGELLVRVKATALNRADLAQRRGMYPPPPGASPIPGLEMAGVVEQVGEGMEGWQTGDRVFALLPGGGYAQYAVIPQEMAMRIPDNLSFEEAAAIPEVFLTAYQCLVWLGELAKGERVLIHAGASGVGTAAIQIVRAFQAHCWVTAGSKEKIRACVELGAEGGFNYRQGPFAEQLMEATEGAGVDIVLDFVGAPYFEQNLQVLAVDGRLVYIATMGGGKVEGLDLRVLMSKRLKLMGTTLRSRSLDYKVRLTRDFASFALERLARGELRPVIDRVLPWTRVQEAHQWMEDNRNIGKIVLQVE